MLDWILAGVAAVALIWGWVPVRCAGTLGQLVVNDLGSDGSGFAPAAAKATLQQELGGRGLLPPSGVPSGFPSVTSIADAISKAPVAQASWLGSLIGLIPFPQASTQFTIGGTLITLPAPNGVRFAYQLVCIGPTKKTELGAGDGADQLTAIENAAEMIYRQIAQAAPGLYPRWARWQSHARSPPTVTGWTWSGRSPPNGSRMTGRPGPASRSRWIRPGPTGTPVRRIARPASTTRTTCSPACAPPTASSGSPRGPTAARTRTAG